MRKTIIAGNWKMHKTIVQAIELSNGLKRELFNLDSELIDIVICPAYTALSEVSELLMGSIRGTGCFLAGGRRVYR